MNTINNLINEKSFDKHPFINNIKHHIFYHGIRISINKILGSYNTDEIIRYINRSGNVSFSFKQGMRNP